MMLWAFIFLLVISVLGGYFILNLPILFLILIIGAGGCIVAFLTFGRLEKETKDKVEKLIKEEKKRYE